jgi:hypothetical protein
VTSVDPDIQRLRDWSNKADTWTLYAHRLEYLVDRLLIDLDIERVSAEHYYFGFDMLLQQAHTEQAALDYANAEAAIASLEQREDMR